MSRRTALRPDGRDAHPTLGPDRARVWWVLLVVAAAFLPVCRYGYVDWDDPLHVYENPCLNPITPAHLAHFWRAPYEGLYVPVSYMAFALLARIGHMAHAMSTPSGGLTDIDPHVFHAANLILHLANVALVFAILRVVIRRDWGAAIGALVFGLHPMQVESVAWISELRGLLATFFALVAVRMFLESVAGGGADGRDAHRTIGGDGRDAHRTIGAYAVGAVVAYGIALLAKPSVIPVPVIALALAWVAGVELRRGRWIVAAWSMLIVPCIVMAHRAQPVSGPFVVGWLRRPFVAGDAITFYLGKLFWPAPMGEDYGRTPTVVLGHWWTYVVWGVPVAVTVAAWLMRRRWPVATASWAIFVAALLPNLGFLPFVFQRFSTVADRYMYLAMLGPALLVAWGVSRVLEQEASPQPSPWKGEGAGRKLAFACLVVGALMFTATSMQVRCWRDSVSLFTHSVAVNPSSSVMHSDLGRAYAVLGDNGRAEDEFRVAIRLEPSNDQAHFNLGVAMAARGDAEEAVDEYRTAIRLEPRDAKAHCNLAGLLAGRRDADGAMVEYRAAVGVNPNLAEAHYGLALLLEQEGRIAEAVDEWSTTVRLWPGSADAHYNMAVAQYQMGDLDGAVRQLRIAVDLDPSRQQARRTLQFVLSKEKRDGRKA